MGHSPVPANQQSVRFSVATNSLPRTNPGKRLRYVRQNGPYSLGIIAGINNKLPYGNIPRLLLAWVSTEAVRTQSRELVLGQSLSEFMEKLGLAPVGGVRTRVRNQMQRLFSAHIQLVHEDERGVAQISSSVADRTELWWNERKPDEPLIVVGEPLSRRRKGADCGAGGVFKGKLAPPQALFRVDRRSGGPQ